MINMKKISLRIEDDILHGVDNLIDNIVIKNRSHAIKHLLKKSLGKEKIAVILAKGSDTDGHNLEKDLLISKTEYNCTAKIKDTTLIKEQIKLLNKYGFNIIYIMTIPKIIANIKKILKDSHGNIIHYISLDKHMKTAEALGLLKDKVYSPFLLFYEDIIFDMNLNDIYNSHLNNNDIATITITTSKNPSVKGYVNVQGTKVIKFIEKFKTTKNSLINEPIYVMSPRIFDIEGKSLAYDIFPKLAEQRLLSGHLSSNRIIHLHEQKDKKEIIRFLKLKS